VRSTLVRSRVLAPQLFLRDPTDRDPPRQQQIERALSLVENPNAGRRRDEKDLCTSGHAIAFRALIADLE
jgi:hypothetical protein